MLKKTIKYVDYNGEERIEDFYFNLSKAELISMQFGVAGGLDTSIKKISQEKDTVRIYRMFEDIIRKSYGEKSPDGKRFIKNDELTEAFIQTEAYSTFIMELIGDPKAASEFFAGVVPADLAKEMENAENQRPTTNDHLPKAGS